MRPLLFLFIVLLNLASCVKKSNYDKLKIKNDSLSTKLTEQSTNVRIKNTVVHELNSKFTKGAYDIYISYPDNYKTSGKKYPVLIVLDAEVNFGAINYVAHRLKKDELAPELLIVGIAYRGETDEKTYYTLRSKDFTPTKDKEWTYADTGGAEDFIKFLSQELFPYLTEKFPIKEDEKILYGHSFGGLFGFHVLLNHTTLFNNYILLSPSLWWNSLDILKSPVPNTVGSHQFKLYVATGSREGKMVNDQLEMVKNLKAVGVNKLKSEILENETHRTVFGRGFTNGLRFIYEK